MPEKSDVLDLLISLLKENEERVDSLARKMEIIENTIANNPLLQKTPEDSSKDNDLTSRNILIVDDDKKLASSFKLILESEGYIVDTADTGYSALFKLTQNRYGLVIIDWHLPDVTGDKVAATIREKYEGTRVIFISGYTYLQDGEESEDEILLKPIEPEALLDTVTSNITL